MFGTHTWTSIHRNIEQKVSDVRQTFGLSWSIYCTPNHLFHRQLIVVTLRKAKLWSKEKVWITSRTCMRQWHQRDNSSMSDWDCWWVELILLQRLTFSTSKAFWISKLMALSTLPEDNLLWDFWRWSLSELLLRPASFPQMGQTFIIGFRCCHSIDAFPCSCMSRSRRVLAKPSFGWARRCTFLSILHASDRVRPLEQRIHSKLTDWMYLIHVQLKH